MQLDPDIPASAYQEAGLWDGDQEDFNAFDDADMEGNATGLLDIAEHGVSHGASTGQRDRTVLQQDAFLKKYGRQYFENPATMTRDERDQVLSLAKEKGWEAGMAEIRRTTMTILVRCALGENRIPWKAAAYLVLFVQQFHLCQFTIENSPAILDKHVEIFYGAKNTVDASAQRKYDKMLTIQCHLYEQKKIQHTKYRKELLATPFQDWPYDQVEEVFVLMWGECWPSVVAGFKTTDTEGALKKVDDFVAQTQTEMNFLKVKQPNLGTEALKNLESKSLLLGNFIRGQISIQMQQPQAYEKLNAQCEQMFGADSQKVLTPLLPPFYDFSQQAPLNAFLEGAQAFVHVFLASRGVTAMQPTALEYINHTYDDLLAKQRMEERRAASLAAKKEKSKSAGAASLEVERDTESNKRTSEMRSPVDMVSGSKRRASQKGESKSTESVIVCDGIAFSDELHQKFPPVDEIQVHILKYEQTMENSPKAAEVNSLPLYDTAETRLPTTSHVFFTELRGGVEQYRLFSAEDVAFFIPAEFHQTRRRGFITDSRTAGATEINASTGSMQPLWFCTYARNACVQSTENSEYDRNRMGHDACMASIEKYESQLLQAAAERKALDEAATATENEKESSGAAQVKQEPFSTRAEGSAAEAEPTTTELLEKQLADAQKKLFAGPGGAGQTIKSEKLSTGSVHQVRTTGAGGSLAAPVRKPYHPTTHRLSEATVEQYGEMLFLVDTDNVPFMIPAVASEYFRGYIEVECSERHCWTYLLGTMPSVATKTAMKVYVENKTFSQLHGWFKNVAGNCVYVQWASEPAFLAFGEQLALWARALTSFPNVVRAGCVDLSMFAICGIAALPSKQLTFNKILEGLWRKRLTDYTHPFEKVFVKAGGLFTQMMQPIEGRVAFELGNMNAASSTNTKDMTRNMLLSYLSRFKANPIDNMLKHFFEWVQDVAQVDPEELSRMLKEPTALNPTKKKNAPAPPRNPYYLRFLALQKQCKIVTTVARQFSVTIPTAATFDASVCVSVKSEQEAFENLKAELNKDGLQQNVVWVEQLEKIDTAVAQWLEVVWYVLCAEYLEAAASELAGPVPDLSTSTLQKAKVKKLAFYNLNHLNNASQTSFVSILDSTIKIDNKMKPVVSTPVLMGGSSASSNSLFVPNALPTAKGKGKKGKGKAASANQSSATFGWYL
eukprot:g8401.t1